MTLMAPVPSRGQRADQIGFRKEIMDNVRPQAAQFAAQRIESRDVLHEPGPVAARTRHADAGGCQARLEAAAARQDKKRHVEAVLAQQRQHPRQMHLSAANLEPVRHHEHARSLDSRQGSVAHRSRLMNPSGQ